MDIIRKPYQRPTTKDIVEFTLNIQPKHLECFSQLGGYFSKDKRGQPDETTESNIRRVWQVLGQQPPDLLSAFACCSDGSSSKDTLRLYKAAAG